MKEQFNIIILVIANYSDINIKFIKNYWIPFNKYVNSKYNHVKIFLLTNNENELINLKKNISLIANNSNQKESLIPGVLEKTKYGIKYIY